MAVHNEALHEAFKLLTTKFQDLELSHKRENKELCMHILVLEEQIHSLEEEVKRLRSKQPVDQVIAPRKPGAKKKPGADKSREAMPRP